jgi:hypothetical protein
MENPQHTLSDLFSQLGLAATSMDIDDFVAAHSPLLEGVALAEASFWTTAQAEFLKEKILDDADWAEVVDQLNERLSA